MPGRTRKPQSIAATVGRFYTLSPAEFYEATYQLLSLELRKSVRTQDWVLIAAVREVGYARGILHQFLKAWEVVTNSIEAGDQPAKVMAQVRLEEEYSANVKDRLDRVGEFEDVLAQKPTLEDITQFPLYYRDTSFVDTPALIQRSLRTRKKLAGRRAVKNIWKEVDRLGLPKGHELFRVLDSVEREMD